MWRVSPRIPFIVLASAAVMCWSSGSALAAHSANEIEIASLSNPLPQLISGGKVLLRVTLPKGVSASSIRVVQGTTDVTSDFQVQSDGTLLGLVTGLQEGANTIEAGVAGTSGGFTRRPKPATIVVTNHPSTGPIFSGPQQEPFYCQTTDFGLEPSSPPYCSAATEISYVYRSTSSEGSFSPLAGAPYKTLANPEERPADLAYTTVNGRSVPFIVRVEEGTIARGVFQIATIYDGSEPSPLHPDSNWNGRLIYTFGGGCNSGYHQGESTGGVFNELFLRQGYAVASSSLNVLETNCSTVISAEVAMMTKEHFIDTFGPVAHTIGWGASGGSIQQYDISDMYPGILNGIVPSFSFPDANGATADTVGDCVLMEKYFAAHPGSFTSAQETAISGFATFHSCESWNTFFGPQSTATSSCTPLIPASELWNEETNPNGVRCNASEQVVNQVGINPTNGFARNYVDNVGVQYGLGALKSKAITFAQFIALNKGIGGVDFAGRPTPSRVEAEPQALKAVYADNLNMNAEEGLSTTPIINGLDYADNLEFVEGADIHTSAWPFVIRARMQKAHDAANQVIIENALINSEHGITLSNEIAASEAYELSAMDQWLDNIEADTSSRSLATKVAHDKPASLVDACFLGNSPTETPTPQPHGLTYSGTAEPCETAYRIHALPRLVAGQPLDLLTLKCALGPIERKAYDMKLKGAEIKELEEVFPTGVCHYKKKGPEEQGASGVWLNYSNAPNGEPFSEWPTWPH